MTVTKIPPNPSPNLQAELQSELQAHTSPKSIGVAIIAPSGSAVDEQALARGITALQRQGCVVYNYYDPAEKYQRFGGTEAARVAQIVAAIDNPQVQIVMALRGSYGLSRILPILDFEQVFERAAASKKHFVGHSDFTVFNLALLAKTGAQSFAGPMLCSDFGEAELSDFTMSHFWQSMCQSEQTIQVAAQNNPTVDVSGTLWGGNLAMVNHLIGTSYFPQIEDGILFLEDIAEHPFRVERLLLQLQYAGILDKQKAIVLGDFSGYRLADWENGYNFDSMLTYLRQQIATPILTGLPFGHIRDKVTLPVGGEAHLLSESDGWQLMMKSRGLVL